MKLIDKDRLNKEWRGLILFGVTEVLAENLKWITDHQPVIEAIPHERIGWEALANALGDELERRVNR